MIRGAECLNWARSDLWGRRQGNLSPYPDSRLFRASVVAIFDNYHDARIEPLADRGPVRYLLDIHVERQLEHRDHHAFMIAQYHTVRR